MKNAKKVGRVNGVTKDVYQWEKNGKYIDMAPGNKIISYGTRPKYKKR
ncbi:MAG: hypothetical protein J6583_10210 [Gilliamella sp.]|nr:hypothetical protein [Gilliamella sp.]